MEKPILQDSSSFVDLCTLHQHAMRYYRLWIYACNTVLALATLVFTVFAVSVLVDPRISLLSGVELYQPTFLYAYVALLLQCGVLQAIGCIGALRLNQRLLNTYWSMLLVLMIGDILVGLVWAFRLDQIKSNLTPMLKQKLVALYGRDADFTEVWDWVQTNDMCCGVDGPIDFQGLNESTFGGLDLNDPGNDTWTSYLHQQDRLQNQNPQSILKLPSTCCVFTVTQVTTTLDPPTSSEVPGPGGGGYRRQHYKSRVGGGNSKGDRSNDPMNQNQNPHQKPGGYYYQQPQHLKGSFHTSSSIANNDDSNPLLYPENFINTYMNTSSSSISPNNNNLVISDLRQSPLTDQVSTSAAAMGYFGPGAALPPPIPPPHTMGVGGTHNRRKISHAKNKHLDEYGYVERNRWSSSGRTLPVTTTESPPPPRPSSAIVGVCVLPSHLKQTPPTPSSYSYANSGESNSASMEDSMEDSSTRQTPTSTMGSLTTTPSRNEGNYPTTTDPSSSTSVPPSSSNSFKTSSSNNHRHHRHPFKFTLSTEQHGEGCGDKILKWVEHSSDVLFVIGFCIIVFLKGCFIAILRYEIKEMIEKIKLLNGEDAGRTAAMNELIGLTSMYESGNEDSGEREGLMSGVQNNNQDTSNTNVDTLDGENGSGRTVIHSGTEGTIGGDNAAARKDSIHFVKENHLIGNNVGGLGPPSRYIGNHVGTTLPANNNLSNNDDYPRVLAVTRESISSGTHRPDIEEDFDSGSALLGGKHCSSDSPPVIGNTKHHYIQHHHRNENGGRNLPKNGNNNMGSAATIENAPVGGPTPAAAPLPIDAIARVTNASIH